jgi:hypothetical protein
MENLNERDRRIINTKHDILMPNEVFTFVTHNNVKLDAVCIKRMYHKYIDELDIVDNIFLCYSQNRLFQLHEIYNTESKEYRIRDLNQTLVDYCIIPEYDELLVSKDI